MQNDKTRCNTGERTRGINRTCTVSEHFCGKRLLLLLIWWSGAELTNQLQIPRLQKNIKEHTSDLRIIWRSGAELTYQLQIPKLQESRKLMKIICET